MQTSRPRQWISRSRRVCNASRLDGLPVFKYLALPTVSRPWAVRVDADWGYGGIRRNGILGYFSTFFLQCHTPNVPLGTHLAPLGFPRKHRSVLLSENVGANSGAWITAVHAAAAFQRAAFWVLHLCTLCTLGDTFCPTTSADESGGIGSGGETVLPTRTHARIRPGCGSLPGVEKMHETTSSLRAPPPSKPLSPACQAPRTPPVLPDGGGTRRHGGGGVCRHSRGTRVEARKTSPDIPRGAMHAAVTDVRARQRLGWGGFWRLICEQNGLMGGGRAMAALSRRGKWALSRRAVAQPHLS